MTQDFPRWIHGHDRLTGVFGRWPSFHDAEVWQFLCERTPAGFDIALTLHVFQMTSEVTETGHFKLMNHTRVVLRFTDCAELQLQGFNHQNVLYGLGLGYVDTHATHPVGVELEGCYGLEGTFRCASMTVDAAEPWTPLHGVYATQE